MCCVQQNVAFMLLPAYCAYFELTRLFILHVQEETHKNFAAPLPPLPKKRNAR